MPLTGDINVIAPVTLSTLPKFSAPKARALVAVSSARIRRDVARALTSIGCWAETSESETDALARNMDMYVVDGDGPNSAAFLRALRQRNPSAIILVLSRTVKSSSLFDLLAHNQVSNLIGRHGVSESDELIDENELITTCHKLLTGDLFGIEKYLSAYGVHVHHEPVASTADKSIALETLSHFLEQLQCPARTAETILASTDELLMNAMFDAPCDASGNTKYADRKRSHPLVLERGERVDLRFACDGRNVVVSVSDRYGSLERYSILRYLQRQFANQLAAPEKKAGGAGLGLHMVFDAITQLVFNIEPGMQTEVIASFYIRGGHKAFLSSGRSLNIFVTPRASEAATRFSSRIS